MQKEETVKDTEQVADDENEENCEQVAVEVVAREGSVDVDKGKSVDTDITPHNPQREV